MPTVQTLAATNVHGDTALVKASVRSGGSWTKITFEYGLDTKYGASITAAPGFASASDGREVAPAGLLRGLTPNTLYHYRVVGWNAVGTAVGADATFTTGTASFDPITTVLFQGAVPPRHGNAEVPGDPVEDGSELGANFKSFGIPSINDAREVAFSAMLSRRSDPRFVTSAVFDGRAIVAGAAGSDPGFRYSDPVQNATGAVAFIAQAKKSPSKRTLYTNLGGATTIVAREGEEAGFGLGKIATLTNFQLLDAGLVYCVRLSSQRKALLAWTHAAGHTYLLSVGERRGTRALKSFTTLTPSRTSPGHPSTPVRDGVGVIARLTFTDGSQAVAQVNTDYRNYYLETGGPIFGIWPYRWKSFGIPAMNRAGKLAFLASYFGEFDARIGRTHRSVFIPEPSGQDFHPVVHVGHGYLPQVSDPIHNSAGDMAVLARVPATPTTAPTRRILYRPHDASSSYWIAQTRDEPPGVPGAKWKSFTSLAMPDELGPVFVGTLERRRGVVSAANDRGLWAMDRSGRLHLLVREGDALQIRGVEKTLRTFTVLPLVPVSPGQIRSFNAAKQIVYRGDFTDGSQAILMVHVP